MKVSGLYHVSAAFLQDSNPPVRVYGLQSQSGPLGEEKIRLLLSVMEPQVFGCPAHKQSL